MRFNFAILGMWSQDWQLYQDQILPFEEFSIDAAMKQLNWTGVQMVEHADDFYRSLSLPAMPAKFWANSIFAKNESFRNCHGTAANMFDDNDYRYSTQYRRTHQIKGLKYRLFIILYTE